MDRLLMAQGATKLRWGGKLPDGNSSSGSPTPSGQVAENMKMMEFAFKLGQSSSGSSSPTAVQDCPIGRGEPRFPLIPLGDLPRGGSTSAASEALEAPAQDWGISICSHAHCIIATKNLFKSDSPNNVFESTVITIKRFVWRCFEKGLAVSGARTFARRT